MAVRLQPVLIRAARGMLNWSILALAKEAGLSVSTVKRMEMGGLQPVSFQAYMQVRTTFEAAGICFLNDNGRGVGLRFKPP